MKEIKAYIRRDRAASAAERLGAVGARGITLVEVHAVGHGEEPNYFVRSDDVFTRYRHAMVKVEVVCADGDAERFVDVLCDAAHTGFRGDGLIFVSEVSDAVRIIDGSIGEKALYR